MYKFFPKYGTLYHSYFANFAYILFKCSRWSNFQVGFIINFPDYSLPSLMFLICVIS